MESQITLVGTPIGNIKDASPRVIDALRGSDVIYAEHPETSKKLAQIFELGKKRWVLFDQKHEIKLIEQLIRDSQSENVVVIPRAGMPGINDPGAHLVQVLHERGITFDVIPGPSIVTCLMATSGHFGPYHYYGYFPKKPSEAEHQLFLSSADEGIALYLESPHRIHKTFTWLKTYLKGCPSAYLVALREWTKMYQMIHSGKVSEIALDDTHPVVGEWAFSICVSPSEVPNTLKMINAAELQKLIRQPYPQRLAKFAAKYGLNS
jgi:16S rRNA (cytidine1402-2'-O)-methyltransferase